MSIEVSDSLSNTNEHIEQAAKAIGKGKQRRAVFAAIYHHKARLKTVAEIAARTKLSRMTVLQQGRFLTLKGIVKQGKKQGDTAYEKINFFHGHKAQILGLAGNMRKLAALPTKRKIVSTLPRYVRLPSAGAKVNRVSIDEIEAFKKVRRVRRGDSLPSSISEAQFKRGIQQIIKEPGDFPDWGGERSDLYTSRLWIKKKRLAAAFAFKGPGLKGRLVLGKMGKNGDQMPRLFQEDAEIFFVQHWREIDALVSETMRNLATAKSVTTGRTIYYGVIDGKDSHRLFLAYPAEFSKNTSKKSGKRQS